MDWRLAGEVFLVYCTAVAAGFVLGRRSASSDGFQAPEETTDVDGEFITPHYLTDSHGRRP